MAQANASLSPKRKLEIARRQRSAVISLALMRAKRAVEFQLRAQGHKVSHYSAKEITLLAVSAVDQGGLFRQTRATSLCKSLE